MSDLIDRQAVIEAIGEKSDEIYKTKQKGATYPHDDFFQGMAYAENVVKQLPSAQLATDTNVGTKLSTNLAEVGTDCISRQAAIDATWQETGYTDPFNVMAAIRDRIKQLPPAQPERIKGHWIHHPEIGWGETWLCDQCGEKTTSTVMGKPRENFCPNCGAEMREVTT